MCELMALSFAKSIPADFSIREFALRSDENADGWGLGWYPDQSLAVVKEPVEWRASPYTGFLETYPHLQARIYIGHVRHKTTGSVATHADTHPFGRELAGQDFCFAHNGTLEGGFWELPLGRFRPIGDTGWRHYRPGDLIVLEGGGLQFSSDRDAVSPSPYPPPHHEGERVG